MPDYQVTYRFIDSFNGQTSRSYKGTFADDTAANAAAGLLQASLIALTRSKVFQERLCKVTDIAGAVAANTLVFNTLSATVALTGKTENANISVPDPVTAVMPANSLITTATEWTDFIANFAPAAGWTISDGDTIASTVSGKRVIDRSGKTNLPT